MGILLYRCGIFSHAFPYIHVVLDRSFSPVYGGHVESQRERFLPLYIRPFLYTDDVLSGGASLRITQIDMTSIVSTSGGFVLPNGND